MKHHHQLPQSPNSSQSLPIYPSDLSLQVLFPELLIGRAHQFTLAGINQNNGLWYSMCQSVPAPKTISVVQPSVCLAQLLLWADPVVSPRVRVEFIPCTSVQFRDLGKSPRACKKKKKLQRRDPMLDDTSEHRKKKNYLAMGILACELEPRCQTQRQLSLSLLASFHVCFVSSYADIMHTVLMPLVFTRFPLNLIQICKKKKSPSCWNNDAAKQRGLKSLIGSQFLNCLTLVFSLSLWVTKSGCTDANLRPNCLKSNPARGGKKNPVIIIKCCSIYAETQTCSFRLGLDLCSAPFIVTYLLWTLQESLQSGRDWEW